jgi:hypothetical protein
MVIEVTDETSGGAVVGGRVTVDGQEFSPVSGDATRWKGNVTVPKGGKSFEVVAEVGGKTTKQVIKYLNKSDPLKPMLMGINPGVYVMVFDPIATRIAKVNLADNVWSDYLTNSQLKGDKILFDFNSSLQHAYTIVNSNQLVAAGISSASPAAFYAGSLPNPVYISYDGTTNARRVLVLSKSNDNVYSALAVAINNGTDVKSAFINPKADTAGAEPAVTTKVWEAPSDAIQGTFVHFNFHRTTKTFVIADEREIDGVKRTVIQGFTEGTGARKFVAEVGPNISNLAINNTDGIIYVAENKSSLVASKLKAIDIASGTVSDMGENKGNITVADYSDLRIDNNKKKLYIGDAVSDSIYEINLATKALSELNITAAQVTVGGTEEN